MEKKSLRRADLVTSIIVFLFSLFVFIESLKMLSATLEKGKNWYISAGLFPAIVSLSLALCAVLLFSRAWRYGARFDFMTKSSISAMLKGREFRVATIIIGWLAMYMFVLLPLLPYWLATFIFLMVFMLCFQKITLRSLIIMTIVATCSTLVLTYGFGTLAMIPLP